MSPEFDDLLDDFVAESLEHLRDVEALLLSLEVAGSAAGDEAVQLVFRAVHSVKGAAGFFELTKINKLAHATEDVLNHLRDKKLTASTTVVDALLRATDRLRSMVANARNSNDVEVDDLIRVLEQIIAGAATPISEEEVDPLASFSRDTGESHASSKIRVSVAILDRLLNLVSELAVNRNRLVDAVSTRQTDSLESISSDLDQLTCELQETILRTRMQPIGELFSRFTRVVRDLCKKLGKQCELRLEGCDVEIDKSIVEAIGDPLLHLLRNALDHGLEKPEERVRNGKPAAGQITLAARPHGEKICIEIQDDGAGMSAAKIREKAIAKGFITPDRANKISDHEALLFIFAPGFSTAAEVTDISGRGVGMDVVQANIESVGGIVDIETAENRGTTIRLLLPTRPSLIFAALA